MTSRGKYVSDYSWRTVVRNVILLVGPNTYRVSVSPVDSGEPGALLPIQNNFLLVDNAGHIFVVISVGSGTIDVRDELLTGEHPVSGLTGIICKSANKGYSNLLPQGMFNYLDKSARPYLESIENAILWANDPNGRRIPFTNVLMPTIADYRADLVDEDGVTFNPTEDYGQNPQFDIFQINEDGTYSQVFLGMNITRGVDGLIDSILFSGTGEEITGYILIKN